MATDSPNGVQGGGWRPPAFTVLPARYYYGWYVAIACAALMFVGVGVGYYGLAVFLKPLQDEHGWSNTAVSGATGMYFVVSGLTSAFIGPRIDRHGPMRYMTIGLILNGLAIASIGFADQLWQLYISYSVLAFAFGMSAGVAVNAIMTRWFIRKRAKAMSISSTGVSLGGVIMAPVTSKLIDIGGMELATPVLGLLVLVVAMPILWLVIAWDPRIVGLPPDGTEPVRTAAPRHLTEEAQSRAWSRADLVRTPSFWALLIGFVLVLTAQTGFVIHQIAFLEERLGSRSEAALTLSITAGGSIIARLVVGQFADGMDKRWLTVALLAIQATAVVLLVATENVPLTLLLTLVFGFTIGNVYMMQSLLVGEIFGMVSFGMVFGLLSFASQMGSGVGPFAIGALDDVTGSYTVPFLISAAMTYLAAVIVIFARPVTAPGLERHPELSGEPVPVRVTARGSE